MVRATAVLLAMSLAVPLAVGQVEEPKPRVVAASAQEIVNEFIGNTDAAVQKYLPPTRDNPNGPLVRVTGTVTAVSEKHGEVCLTVNGGRVILTAKALNDVQPGDSIEAVGRFHNYFKRTVLIRCDEVKPIKP